MTLRPLIIAGAITALSLPTIAVAGASKDRDHDGMPTKWEQRYKLNPKVDDARKDKDRDGLSNLAEYQSKTSPRDADSDDDGTDDAREDSDRDGVENEVEAEHGLHPGRKDSDGDGVRDHNESAGSVASFDGTTLVITLLDGSSLSGTVSGRTEIECEGPRSVPSPAAAAARLSSDEAEDDDAKPSATPKPSPTPKPSETPRPSSSEEDDHAEDHSGAGSSEDEAEDHGNSCDATDLVAGASVRKAKVRGGVFEKVHLNR